MQLRQKAVRRIVPVIEQLESRQLLSVAVQAAAAKIVRAHALRAAAPAAAAVVPSFHKGNHPKGRRLGAERAQAAAATTAAPLVAAPAATPIINVGTINLLPNTPNQLVTLSVSGGGNVTGFNLDAVLGNGTASGAEPKFQAVTFGSPTLWTAHPTTVTGGPLASAPQDAQASVVFNAAGDTVAAAGNLVTLTIDTTGFAAGTSFPLSLKATEIGQDSQFLGTGGSTIPASITNGTINIAAAPAPGLVDAVYHGDAAYTSANTPTPTPDPNGALNDAVFGGDNAAVTRVANWAATHTPNYTFTNTHDAFVYGNASTTNSAAFLGADAAGAALTDPANVTDTIFDAQGYFLTPTANDAGTYTVTLGAPDDVIAVYVGGNGTPGSGTLVASAGWQGANAGLPGFQITLSAGTNAAAPASVPIEILYGNGFGGATQPAATGSNPATGVRITDPNGVQVTSFQTSASNLAALAAPGGVKVAGYNPASGGPRVNVTFPAVVGATSYAVQRAPESSPGSGTPGTFATVPGGGAVTGNGTISFTDSDPALTTTANYFYRVIAASGSQTSAPSNPVELTAIGAFKSEGIVEVDVRAATLPTGPLASITNLGAAGGSFNAVGSAVTVGTVTDSKSAAYPALQFNSNSATSTFNAPSDLTGNASRSIEVWVDNPTIDGIEETMVSWAHRGGPDGTNESFSYGSTYGIGQWGAGYDMTWANTAPGVTGAGAAPVANGWHYLVFTYDGANNNVYVDGNLYLQTTVPAGGLNTAAGLPINLAAQNTAATSGYAPDAGTQGVLDLASVRIATGALTPADVQANYVAGVPGRPAATTAPTTAPTLNPITSAGQINLTWSYDPNATFYNIYRTDVSHPTAAIATGVTSLAYTDNAITAGTTYTYYVTSANNIGQGPPSNTQSAKVNALTTAPTLAAPAAGSNQVALNWSNDPNAVSYSLFRSDAAHPTPTAVATGLKTLSYTDTTARNGTTYTYYVTSVNAVSSGPRSNTQTATPQPPGPQPPVNILTHDVNARNTGANQSETVLTPANVNSTNFGKQWAATLDGGDVIAQPLYVQNVNISTGPNAGVHSVVFVATEADGLYALDANTATVLWHDNFTNVTDPTNLTATSGVTTILQGDIANNPDVGPQLGILATPALDLATGRLYLNANTKEIRGDGKHFVQRLWAIDIKTGQPVVTPEVIGDTIAPNGVSNTGPYTYVSGPIVNGTGNNNPAGHPTPVYPNTDGWVSAPGGATGYVVAFNAIEQMERTAVSLINGNVYLGFASHGDAGPYYGWVLGYNATTLAPTAVFNTTPTYEPASAVGASTPFQQLGGIWMSGANITTDGTNLYLATGNGAFNGDPSNFDANGFPLDHDYADSVLKLSVDPNSSSTNQNGNGWGLKVADYFTPSNQFELNDLDLDLGSGGVTVLPDNVLDAAGNPMLAVGGKESRIYLLDRNNMGKFNYTYPTGPTQADPRPYDRVVGEYANHGTNQGGQQVYSSGVYYNGNLYFGVHGQPGLELSVAGLMAGNVTPVRTNQSFGYPSEAWQISSAGTSNAIAWALNPGVNDLVAFDASNFSGAKLYDSTTVAGDALGGSLHFHVPMIANGMVYAGSRGGGLSGYGLRLSYLQSDPSFFGAPTQLYAMTASATDAFLSWTSNSSLATEYRVDRSPHGANTWTTLAYVNNSNTTYDDASVNAGTTYDYRVVAVSGANVTAPSNVAALQPPLPAYITASTGAVYTYDPNASTLALTAGTLTFTDDEANNVPSYGAPLAVSATGANAALVLQTSQHLAGLSLTDATATLPAGTATTLNLSGSLTLTGNGTLDLGKASMLLPTSATIGQYITRAAGSPLPSSLNPWTGPGLTSSLVKADAANGNAKQLVLGYWDSRDNGNTGLSVPAGMTLVKYTVYGDATGDGKVSIADLSVWNNNFGASSPRWSQGDFNYDGKVNIADLSVWNNDFGNKAPA